MKKYHVNLKGAVEVCKAKEGRCPFSDTSIHSESFEEAQVFADKSNVVEMDYLDIVKNEPRITNFLESSLPEDVYMEGREFRVKALSSTKRKVLFDSEYNSCNDLYDIVRYTTISSEEYYSKNTLELIERLSKENKLVATKLRWEKDCEYKGVHMKWENKETGTKWELQIHTPESWKAKNEAHVLYEKERRPGVLKKDAIMYKQMQKSIFEKVPRPDMTNLIEKFGKLE